MLDLCEYIIRQSDLHKSVAAENAMICHNHFCVTITLKTLNLSTAHVLRLFNNTQKLVNSPEQKKVVQQFKERQGKRRHT